MVAANLLQGDLMMLLAHIAENEGCASNVAQQQISAIELLRLAVANFHRDRRIGKLDADQRHAHLFRLNRRGALPGYVGVHQQKLPCRRRAFRDDAVVAAMDGDVVRLISNILNTRASFAGVNVDVGQKRVLCHMEPYRDSCRIAVANLEVDIAERAIKRKLIGIDDGAVSGWPTRGELHHIAACPKETMPLLEAGRVRRKNQRWSMRTVPDQPNPRPQIDSVRQAVVALGKK